MSTIVSPEVRSPLPAILRRAGTVRHFTAMVVGKAAATSCKLLRLGAGSAWPGELALACSPHVLDWLQQGVNQGFIVIAGTNGKTTTALMIKSMIEQVGQRVIHNATGANLLNGVVSALIQQADWTGKAHADWGVLEVDENSLPLVLDHVAPRMVVLLNLFRDQLDRYGEVDVIAEKWIRALRKLPSDSVAILNADDPLIAHIGKYIPGKTVFYGLEKQDRTLPAVEHAADSIFCMNCGGRLTFSRVYYSHLGIWSCPACGERRPEVQVSRCHSPLPGLYNTYNTLAAVGAAQVLGIEPEGIERALDGFSPAFGRQEEFVVYSRRVRIILSKNPVSFNASLRTILDSHPKALLVALNDRVPDGRDVSWIWDVDFEMIPKDTHMIASGDRAYDLALRIKYAHGQRPGRSAHLLVVPELNRAIRRALRFVEKGETLYILPTYSAMLEVRKCLIGRKIL